jgi:hypothetical protein
VPPVPLMLKGTVSWDSPFKIIWFYFLLAGYGGAHTFHMCIVSAVHRVDSTRLFLQSSELGPSTPSPAGECVPSPFGSGRREHARLISLAGEGVGGPDSDEGTDTVVLYVYIYFVGRGDFTSFVRKVLLCKQLNMPDFFLFLFTIAYCTFQYRYLHWCTLTYFTDRIKGPHPGIMFLLPKTGAANQLLRGPVSVPVDKQVV